MYVLLTVIERFKVFAHCRCTTRTMVSVVDHLIPNYGAHILIPNYIAAMWYKLTHFYVYLKEMVGYFNTSITYNWNCSHTMVMPKLAICIIPTFI